MTTKTAKQQKTLSIVSLVLMTVGSVDSVRNLPATALFGSSLIFFFLLAGVVFLIPSSLVSAELASGWPKKGGVYAWVREAFGHQAGFLAIWFQWIENVIWYPTLLSFIAGTLAYLINPELAHNPFYLLTVVLGVFWSVTFLNLRGIKASAWFSNFCAIFGLIVPMTLIIILGLVWYISGLPMHISFSSAHILPAFSDPNLLVAMTGVILCYCGMELTCVHAQDVKNPQRDYPIALLISVVIIMFTLLAGSLAIAVVLPHEKISLVAGLMQAFNAFFEAFHLSFLGPILAILIVIGGLGGLNSWIIAPSRGLQYAFEDLQLLPQLTKENPSGAPKGLLLLQAVICSLVSGLFLFMPTINSAYWMLTVLASQLYMIMYILLFAAGIYLRYCAPDVHRPFKVPGGNVGMWFIATTGMLAALFTIIIGFYPPAGMHIQSTLYYQLTLLIGLIMMSVPPFIIYGMRKASSPLCESA